MPELYPLIEALGQLAVACATLAKAILVLLSSHWALFIWIAFFLWIVRWPDLRAQLRQGAWVPAFLVYFISALVWGLCSESVYSFGTWSWPSVLEKFVVAAAWVVVAFLCGALQDHLGWAPPEQEIAGPPEDAGAANAPVH